MKPIIGITCRTHKRATQKIWNYIPEQYVRAIESAGGIPLLIPLLESKEDINELVKKIDCLLLSGGADIDPFVYGEKPVAQTKQIDKAKDFLEINLAKLCLKFDLPILGICRGCQVLNIAAGGTLNQHITRHYYKKAIDCTTHEIEIKKGTLLSKIIGREKLMVNSFHHQSVRDVAKEFKVSAIAKDDVIEAIESYPWVLGIQFHAEYLWQKEPLFMNIFSSFVNYAKI